MKQGDIFNVVFLSIINIVFMVAGIFLNSVVMISLWRSRQLRKKLCYFMILILSCVDLALVTVTHPLLISSTIYYALEGINVVREVVIALFTLNVERFLALTCPFFHQASVTKTRLVCFLTFVTIIIAALPPLVYFNTRTNIVRILIAVYFLLVLFLIIYGNYRIFTIARSKREHRRVAPTTARRSTDERRKRRILSLKIFLHVLWRLAAFSFVPVHKLYIQLYAQHQKRYTTIDKLSYLISGHIHFFL